MAVPELKPIEGKYEILEKLNEGGMGAVYKVRHRLLEEIRVIKVIRPQLQSDENLRRRFLREARAAVRLRHPNIAELYDFTVADDGTAYMVIEFIDGVDLVGLIEQSEPPNLPLVLDIGVQSLRALAYLHRKQFVHRDISPDNLMLTKDVEGHALVKLIDMGIAKPLQSEMNLTGEGLFLGKVRYASPEQFGGQTGSEEIDQRSDLYSFGIVLYELLTGVHPIKGEDNQTVLAGHLFHPPRSFDETDPQNRVPERLRSIVCKALEKSAADRYCDADAFSNELAGLASELIEIGPPTSELDATVVQTTPRPRAGRPGSTQDRLDLEFAPQKTPPPRPFEAVPPLEDHKEALLQSCCDKVESLIESKRLHEAEVELQRGEKTLGSSILLADLGKRIKQLRDGVNEAVVRARLLQRDGDLGAALEKIGEAKEVDNENPEVGALFDEVREALKERERAIERARQTIAGLLETGQLEEAQARLTEVHETFGRFARLDDLQEQVDTLQESADRVRKIGRAAAKVKELIEAGKLQRAAAALAAATRTHGDDEMFGALAEQIESQLEQEEAKDRLAQQADRRRRVNSLLEMAQQHADAENYEAALELIRQAIEISPDDPQIQTIEHRVQVSLERRDQQQRRAAELEKLTAEFEGRLLDGDLDVAQKLLEQAVATHGDLHELAALQVRIDEVRVEQREKTASEVMKQAFQLFEAGDLDEAARTVDRALALSPGLPQATKLQKTLVERRREESRLRTLDTARRSIMDSLNSGALDQAAQALAHAKKELGSARELQDLEKRLEDRQAREARRHEVGKIAQRIEKLIQKNRLDKASNSLAEAVRAHGQDTVFDELRARVEEIAGREQAAQEILAAEVGEKPTTRSRALWIGAVALLLVSVAVMVYMTRNPAPTTTEEPEPTQEMSAVATPSLDDLLAGHNFGEFHALVVGNNSYERGLPDLDTAVNDAQELASTLRRRFGFETEVLLDATRYETLSALESYVSRLDDNDNLLVFYAGHGFVDDVTGRGYWQPTDAEPDNTANWISSLEVSDLLLDIPAQRVLVVADSCFSGAFTHNEFPRVDAPEPATDAEIVERLEYRSRWVLSSGSLQPVLDNGFEGNSVFSRALLTSLEESPGAIELTTLFALVQRKVNAATVGMELQQQPQFAPLDSDDGGVFLFVPTTDSAG